MPQVPRAALLCTTTRWVRIWEKIQQHRKEFRNERISLKIWVQSLPHELKWGQPLQKNMCNSHSMLVKGGKSIRAGTTCLGLEHSGRVGYHFRFFVAWTISSQLTLQQSNIAMKDEPSDVVYFLQTKRTVHCYLMDACELISGPAEPVFVRGAQYQHTCSMNRHKIENDRNQCFVERFSFRSLPGVCYKTCGYFPFVPQVIDRSQQKVTRTKAGHNNQTSRNGKSEEAYSPPPQKKKKKQNLKVWNPKKKLGLITGINWISTTWDPLPEKFSSPGIHQPPTGFFWYLPSLQFWKSIPPKKKGQLITLDGSWIVAGVSTRGMEHSRRPSRFWDGFFYGKLGEDDGFFGHPWRKNDQLRVGYRIWYDLLLRDSVYIHVYIMWYVYDPNVWNVYVCVCVWAHLQWCMILMGT